MATNYYESFIKKLQEIFMMDHAELDFGIYRIMNQKRADINHFLKFELLPQVKTALADAPDGSENEVFSHLVTFFSRYYDNGDFISKRRYKDNTYAIPYNGEEVKLHWANADQYYIKSSEYFRDYSFVLPTSRRKVHFVLKDASTEQNNNKTANNMERRFALYKPETEGESFYEVNGDELNIFFTYELMPKGTKQNDLMAEAFGSIKEIIPLDFSELLTVKSPTDKNANRTLLEKHLTDYTAKNSFDYFIHKDLGGFLCRELDFYIKNEVMLLDDLDVQHIESQLNIIKAIKLVGEKIIRMLAQLEDFQKKLWLKKKFVVQSDYCITIDRVPRKLYPEILANERQREEWVRLFAIDEIKGDLTTEAYSVPLTMEFLDQNPFLVLDTAFFSKQFKHKLVASMENVDRDCNGLLINSENFQALELLQEKYRKIVNGVYTDPLYNTGSDGFLYKDGYNHSSWLSMINERISLTRQLLSYDAPIFLSLNSKELANFVCSQRVIDTWFSIKVRHEERLLRNDIKYQDVMEYLIQLNPQFTPSRIFSDSKDSLSDYIWDISTATNPDEILFIGDFTVEKYLPNNYKISNISPNKNGLKRYLIRGSLITQSGSASEYYEQNLRLRKDIDGPGCLYKVMNMGVKGDGLGYRYIMQPLENGGNNGIYFQGYPLKHEDKGLPHPNLFNFEPAFNSCSNEGGVKFAGGKKPLAFLDKVFEIASFDKDAIILDFFAGSAPTAQETMLSNIRNNANRKYILIEMAEYFQEKTKTRTIRSIYSPNPKAWQDGKPVSRQGISQCFKYMRLEQYEDTLNNLKIKEQQTTAQFDEGSGFKESYMLEYMLDVETRDSLLNLKMFENPFAMTLKTTKDNELVETEVDMVETFNYLIGLNVETEDWYRDENICVVQGHTHRDNLHTLVIWRNCKEIDNEQLNQFFERMNFRTRDSEFDIIYVNGDNLLPNLRRDEDNWKVVLIEEEFTKRMFETE
mgnify:FL=1